MVLPKINRLKLRKEFSAIYQGGLRRKSVCLTLRALRSKTSSDSSKALGAESFQVQEPTRIGISISSKVNKRAVVRNRMKRQIRAALRQLLPNISQGWKIVIVVRPEASQCDYHQFLQELRQLLVDAEVIDGY